MNIDDPDLTPAGGSLAGPVMPRASEPVAQFTQTGITHPDAIWSPRGSEIAPPGRPLPQPATYDGAPERPVQREIVGDDIPGHLVAARMVRAATRPVSF